MRRLNIRKRKQIEMKDNNKKALRIIVVFCILIIVFTSIYFYFIKNHFIKGNFEKAYTSLSHLNEETAFALEKITIFSSATATPKEVNNSVWNLAISQYSDIAITLKSFDLPKDLTIQRLYLDNIQINKPEYGIPLLYQKSLNDFGKCTYAEDTKEDSTIEFSIVDDKADISTNTIDRNLSLPITLGYYNQNVKENFFDADTSLEYNGKLLKKASIPPSSIETTLSFDIHILTVQNEEYVCNISIAIPLEDNEKSVYENGYITKEIRDLENYKFLRIK